jgi:predicted transcriptional regulator
VVRVSRTLPPEFESLGSRQRELFRLIYAQGGATVQELHDGIPDPPPSVRGLRTLLGRMVSRGLLRVRPSGRHRELLYLPGMATPDVRLCAFDRIAKEHFRGSKFRAADALEKLAMAESSLREEAPARKAA